MLSISSDLIQKYSVPGPRYTSYPTAPMWYNIDLATQKEWYADAGQEKVKPLSLYFHIPFCWQRCYYCGCNTIVTNNPQKAAEYVDYLLKEIDQLAATQRSQRELVQLHIGGGTPTFLSNEDFRRIIARVRQYFPLGKNYEMGIEIDPRTTKREQLEFLSELGFNRISMGVQDFDPTVQETVNRVQSEEITFEHLQTARQLNFKGINFDLIYGLPNQSIESFDRTLKKVIEMHPDRLAVYNYAHVPNHNPYQNRFTPELLPDADTKLQILINTIDHFCSQGYEYIGMDHFALPEDELTLALKNRTLHRNFMGYTTRAGCDLYGIGLSSIGEFGNYFMQNEKGLVEYKEKIDNNGMAGIRGIKLSLDDQKRKWVILRIMCHFFLSFDEYKETFGENFMDYFADEVKGLDTMREEGLVEVTGDAITVTDSGKFVVRNICMFFDAYIKREDKPKVQFSKTL